MASLDQLLQQEKDARQGEEVSALQCGQILCSIIQYFKDRNDYEGMQEMLVALAKRRRQPKQSIGEMVRYAMQFLDELPKGHQLLHCLRSVAEGKIYLEQEYAKLTMILSKIREDEGNPLEASNLLNEVQIETYGSVEKGEKLAFLLSQLRLLIELNDFVRFQIISKKVSRKILDEPEYKQEKIQFLEFMVKFYDFEKNYMEAALAYKTIYETNDDSNALQNMVLYLLLVPHSPEQIDLLIRIVSNPALSNCLFVLASILLGNQIGRMPEDIKQLDLDSDKLKVITSRINQHNIRTISKYYTKITITRASQLLDLSLEDTEKEIRDMVSYEGFRAKINRPDGWIQFSRPDSTHERLNQWGSDIHSLLLKLEEVNHLINREHIVFN